MNNSEIDFELRVRSALDSGVANLDAETRSRLAGMRNLAFERKPFWSRWLSFDNWVPVTAFATVAVLTVSLLFIPSGRDTPVQLAMQDSEVALELLFNEDGHEEVGDPDFYIWLDVTMAEDEEPKNAS
jgi:hypothetical protein